jgi:hypothetical protein
LLHVSKKTSDCLLSESVMRAVTKRRAPPAQEHHATTLVVNAQAAEAT